MPLIRPYQLNSIEGFENLNTIYNSPDVIPIPPTPSPQSSSNSMVPPLAGLTYNMPTVPPVTLAPTMSPMEATIKEFTSAGASSSLSEYKTRSSVFGAASVTPPAPTPQMPIYKSVIPTMPSIQSMPTPTPPSKYIQITPPPPSPSQSESPRYIQITPAPPSNPIIESFYGSKLEDLRNDRLLLKCLLFALLFYFLANGKVLKFMSNKLPNFDPLVINMIIFVVILLILNSLL